MGQAKVGTIKSKVREWTAREDLLVPCAFLLQGFSTAAWAAEKVPERNTGSANRHNGIKLTNKGRGPVRPRLKDCSVHTNRPPAPIQEPFPKHLQTHKGWHPTPTLQSAGPIRKRCVFRCVCCRHGGCKRAPTRSKTCNISYLNLIWSGLYDSFKRLLSRSVAPAFDVFNVNTGLGGRTRLK